MAGYSSRFTFKSQKAKAVKMAEAEVDDTALKVFGTPERELRRRWLHPQGYPADGEEDVDQPQETTSDEV